MVFLEDSSDKLFFPPLTRQHTEEREEAKVALNELPSVSTSEWK